MTETEIEELKARNEALEKENKDLFENGLEVMAALKCTKHTPEGQPPIDQILFRLHERCHLCDLDLIEQLQARATQLLEEICQLNADKIRVTKAHGDALERLHRTQDELVRIKKNQEGNPT